MTGEPEAEEAARPLADEGAQGQDAFGLGERERDAMVAWVGENLPLVRRAVELCTARSNGRFWHGGWLGGVAGG